MSVQDGPANPLASYKKKTEHEETQYAEEKL